MIETVAEARHRTAQALAFDGVYRAYVDKGLDSWSAEAFEPDGRMGKRKVGPRSPHATEAEAQAEADELNAAEEKRKRDARLF